MNEVLAINKRRRSTPKHESILDAAAAIAHDIGYDASTIEAIAAEAGVGKQTIYRWWPSKAALYLETYKHLVSGIKMPGPDHSCNDRLRRFLTALFRQYGKTGAGAILRGLIGEMASDEEVRQAVRAGLLLERSTLLLEPVQEGIRSGELSAIEQAEDAVEIVIALIWKQLLVDPKALNAHFAKRVIANVLGRC